jgi:hypothetical protein
MLKTGPSPDRISLPSLRFAKKSRNQAAAIEWNLFDYSRQRIVRDKGPVPKSVEKLLAADDAPALPNQIDEYVESARRGY